MIGRRLTMRAHVMRNVATGKDGWGQPVAPDYQALGVVPCFAWAKSGSDIVDGKKVAITQGLRMMFGLAADIVEADQIAQITDRAGTVLFAGRLRIEGDIEFKHNHREAALVRVAG